MRRIPMILALAAIGAQPAFAADVQRGKAIAQEKCARCHAIGKHGPSPFAQAPPFRDLHLRYPLESLEESMAEGLSSGHPAMPVFTFTPADIDAFIAYLHGLDEGPDRPDPPASPGRS
ncbi:c-type cytochrome [Prosthecomicrobium pneumaticum]|uniref:Mono/diheme cytochrome c family protein n=1 Tax=Prosthecomicrobium pneumaticum TaxID=81895 RepID=A0A7W9CTL2_9HYPH|nr:cytochrome c [Prosthecomicrobium pneumaticum]MBB5751172.1 mono/diheme cytochrome c family protein [Prosthecomicrobium pneumaticum]